MVDISQIFLLEGVVVLKEPCDPRSGPNIIFSFKTSYYNAYGSYFTNFLMEGVVVLNEPCGPRYGPNILFSLKTSYYKWVGKLQAEPEQ